MLGDLNSMIKYFTMVLIAAYAMVLLSGCGAHYVAADKNLGISTGKKPVVGTMVTSFVVNTETNPVGALLALKYGEEIAQSLKDQGVDAKVVKLNDIKTHPQLAAAVEKYNSLPQGGKWITNGFEFGDMRDDFKALGIDMLVILSGSAGNASIPGWVQLTTLAAFRTMGLATPASDTFVTTVNRDGKPLYNEKTTFTRMGRRDFGNDSHRKAMAEAIADGIKDKSL